MVVRRVFFLLIIFLFNDAALAEQAGIIRGAVYDKEFDAPLAGVQVSIAETGQKVTASEDGNFVFDQVVPGTYTIVFAKDGYERQVTANVAVSPGSVTELDASLSGEFTEMEELVVQDVQIGSGTEESLLNLRMESPALMDSVSSDLMSRAGAGDAASALKLVSGATVQDGKYAVIRGLPDRYVVSQMNGVRLPTADSDKRAVQLDQFPSSVIESIQVTKTFTPDQQGDASGGAVNIVLKSIPDEPIFKVDAQTSMNTQEADNGKFLTYKGADPGFWGKEGNKIPSNLIGQSWPGPDGVSYGDQPTDYKWSVAGGGKHKIDEDIKIGGFGSFFYERDSSFYDDGVNDKYFVETPGGPMVPASSGQDDFKTKLFDVTQGSQGVKWGGLGTVGLETENHSLSLTYMYTKDSESKATLAEDTRGKKYYFPDYDRNDPTDPGNQARQAAPYLRLETLEYTERITHTLQLKGRHKLQVPEFVIGTDNLFTFRDPELDWGVSRSYASLDQPDKTQFGSLWYADSYNPGFPPYLPPFTDPAIHLPYKSSNNFTIGNFQRIWKDISEDSMQYYSNLKYPFEQWSGDKGYLKFGLFRDEVDREYNQDTYSNLEDLNAYNGYQADWKEYWSRVFPNEDHKIYASEYDVDYKGRQDISAAYYMVDIPLNSWFNIIGGTRFEKTELDITNDAESQVTWVPPGSRTPVTLNPGDADVSFKQDDVLPSIGFVFKPHEKVKLHGSYSETVARQTFKELTPIQQSEYLGADVFVGNPELQMSALKNYDLRTDYTPYEGGLVSLSYFYKDITDPIEYVQRNAGFTYTTAMNYPKGKLDGYEIEFRQKLEKFWESFEGLSLGANATFINSEVTLPDEEAAYLDQPGIQAPMSKRDMTNAPEHLYNIFMTYEMEQTGTQLGLFYTVRGDTLIAGADGFGNVYIPNVYEKEYGTLNASLIQKLNKNLKLKFQAKNLLDPLIETVYRSEYIDGDVTKTSYRKGMEFSISISAQF